MASQKKMATRFKKNGGNGWYGVISLFSLLFASKMWPGHHDYLLSLFTKHFKNSEDFKNNQYKKKKKFENQKGVLIKDRVWHTFLTIFYVADTNSLCKHFYQPPKVPIPLLQKAFSIKNYFTFLLFFYKRKI